MTEKLAGALETHRPRLLRFIRASVRSLEDAEDILQDVFLQAVRHLNVLESVDNLLAWLYVAARRKIVDWYRRRARRHAIAPSVPLPEDDGEGKVLENVIASVGLDPADELVRTWIAEAVEAAIDDLPPEQRFAFVEQEIAGRTFRELSAETGIPVNTLISRKRAAVMRLRSELEDLSRELDRVSGAPGHG